MIAKEGMLVQFTSENGNGNGFINYLVVDGKIVQQTADVSGSGNATYIHYRFVDGDESFYTDQSQLPDCKTSFKWDCPDSSSAYSLVDTWGTPQETELTITLYPALYQKADDTVKNDIEDKYSEYIDYEDKFL